MTPVKISWEKEHSAKIDGGLLETDQHTSSELIEKVKGSSSRCFQFAAGILAEIPPPAWKHGEVLIYMVEEGWLVRRNYADYWYVDMGVVRPVGPDLYIWTDLWLDVTMPESADRYRLHDADEFAEAIESASVSRKLAARSLRSLHSLVELIRAGDFPTQDIRDAVDRAYSLRES